MIELPAVDMDNLVECLLALLRTPSPTGDSAAAISLVEEWVRGLGLLPERTRKGALVVTLPGRSDDRPIALTAHVDTLGAIVQKVKPNGRLAFDRIGGYPYHAVNGEYCIVRTSGGQLHSGTAVLVKSSVHVHREQVRDKDWQPDEVEIRLDADVTTAEAVHALGIEVGDFIAWDPRTTVTETGYVKSRHLDDKAGVAVMVGALKALVDSGAVPQQRVTFHISNYEEVGHGAAAGIPADVAELLAVDMGALGEGLQGTERAVSICVKDSAGPYDLEVRRRLVDLARRYGVPYHLDIYPNYGSDAEAALRAGGDHRIGLFGPGIDASHSYERTHRDALEGSARLLLAYLLDE